MEEYVFIGRVLERLFIVLGGFFCLWLSTRVGASNSQSDAKFKWENFGIEVKKIGPNIFFGIFGCIILIASISSPLERQVKNNGESNDHSIRYLSTANEEIAQRAASEMYSSISEAEGIIPSIERKMQTPMQIEHLLNTIKSLSNNKNYLRELAFGQVNIARFENASSKCMDDKGSQDCKTAKNSLPSELFIKIEKFGRQ